MGWSDLTAIIAAIIAAIVTIYAAILARRKPKIGAEAEAILEVREAVLRAIQVGQRHYVFMGGWGAGLENRLPYALHNLNISVQYDPLNKEIRLLHEQLAEICELSKKRQRSSERIEAAGKTVDRIEELTREMAAHHGIRLKPPSESWSVGMTY